METIFFFINQSINTEDPYIVLVKVISWVGHRPVKSSYTISIHRNPKAQTYEETKKWTYT